MAFKCTKIAVLPPPPPRAPPPLTNPGYTTITGVAKGDTRAHSPIPPLIGELKRGLSLSHTFPRSVTLLLHLCPPLTNPGYTTVTGVAKGSTRAQAPR